MKTLTDTEIGFIHRLTTATKNDVVTWTAKDDHHECTSDDSTITMRHNGIVIYAPNHRVCIKTDAESIVIELKHNIELNIMRQKDRMLNSIVFGAKTIIAPTVTEDINDSILHVRKYLKQSKQK